VYAGGRLLAVVTTTNVTALPSGCVFETPLLSGETVITAVLVTELRTCVNNLRTQRGLSTVTWTDPTLTPTEIVIKAVHLSELRTALSAVYTAASLGAPAYTDPTLVAGETTIKAVYFTELRGAVAEFPTLIATPQIRYYHLDAIGSVRAITDASGTTVARYDFEPFGAEVPPLATVRDPIQCAGTERDAETGSSSWQPLDYLGARYTQNRLARFLSPDDPAYGNPFEPQSMNQYAYGYNNPLRFIDPTGHQSECVDTDYNACVNAPAPPDVGLIQFLLGIGRPVATAVQQVAEATNRFVTAPRDPGCMANWVGAGAARGLAVGTALGVASGGVGIVVTAPGAIAVNVAGGAAVGSVACMGSANGGAGGGGSGYRDKTRGANRNDRQMVEAAARKEGVDRWAFGKFIDRLKRGTQRGPSENFTFEELRELARQFKAGAR
jgi:RHS repeat-associated protein